MKRLAVAAACLSLVVGGGLGVNAVVAGPGEGHTPIVVCHWVPAAPAGAHSIPGPDGGSYVVITVDDDGANGNKNLEAHMHHLNDIIGDPTCGQSD